MKTLRLNSHFIFNSIIMTLATAICFTSCCRKHVTVTTYAGNGTPGNTNGPGKSARFTQPTDVAIDAKGNLFVADKGNNLIRKISMGQTVTTHFDWGARSSGGFVAVRNIDADGTGRVYVIDDDNLSLRKIEGGTAPTVTGFRRDDEFYDHYLPINGGPDSASFFYLNDLTLNADDNLLHVLDKTKTSSIIRKVSLAGYVTTPGYPAANPGTYSSITMDGSSNIYVALGSKIIRITPAGISTEFAGSNEPGYADGAGNVARFNGITSIDADKKGNVYVSDSGNNRIRKVSPAGVVTTIAGNGIAGFADGPGLNAQFNGLEGLVVYKCALYVADRGNNSIRKITIGK